MTANDDDYDDNDDDDDKDDGDDDDNPMHATSIIILYDCVNEPKHNTDASMCKKSLPPGLRPLIFSFSLSHPNDALP